MSNRILPVIFKLCHGTIAFMIANLALETSIRLLLLVLHLK